MCKRFGTFIFLTAFISMFFSIFFAFNVYADVDTSTASKGYIAVNAKASTNKPYVVQVKNGKQVYNYTLTDSKTTNIPLQLGSGSYKIILLELVSGNQYRAVSQKALNVVDAGINVYTNSIQLIDFNKDMASIKTLTNLISDNSTVEDKINELYGYLINNFSYDFNKASALANATSYLPNIDTVFNNKKGICYDFSSLFAAVLRYNNIPTKLAMGYTPKINVYHAWNQVYYNSSWKTVDITYDIGMKESKVTTTMVKKDSDYSVSKIY